MSKHDLERKATELLKSLSKFDQLKELGNRNHYPSKLKKLEEKIGSELDFWKRKGPSARLSDLERDMDIVQKQKKELFIDKEKIDLLTSKYSISYEQTRNSK
jgi:hypothetical protein